MEQMISPFLFQSKSASRFMRGRQAFGADMKILFPQAIVNEMRAFIQELSEMYKDDGKM